MHAHGVADARASAHLNFRWELDLKGDEACMLGFDCAVALCALDNGGGRERDSIRADPNRADVYNVIQSDLRMSIWSEARCDELPYVPGQTYVLEIKLLCGHEDFAKSGGNMLRHVIGWFANAIKEGYGGRHTHFICVADAVDVGETKSFYERMGFKVANIIQNTVTDDDGNFKRYENLFRFVRLVRIRNSFGPGGL